MQEPSGIGGSVAIITFATWHKRFGPVTNRQKSAVLGVSFVLSFLIRFGTDLRGMRAFAYTRLWFDYGAVFFPCYGWRFGRCKTHHFWRCKKTCSEERACCLLRNPPIVSIRNLGSCQPCAPNTLLSAFPSPSPLFLVRSFASVKTKTYSRAGTNVTVLLKAAMYFAPLPLPRSGRRLPQT